jgi:uncharacterized membrane protein
MQTTASSQHRNTGLDALRGIAVMLMVEQHLGAWLWNEPWNDVKRLIDLHPFMMGLNGLGGFAAPLFIMLAGAGTQLFILHFNQRSQMPQVSSSCPEQCRGVKLKVSNADITLAIRGLILISFGYALNIAVPSWFSPASWYVLHMIGFGLAISPLLRRIRAPYLLLTGIIILLLTVFVRSQLQTPAFLSNARMGDGSCKGGMLRLACAEGHFPLLPWLASFLWGAVCMQWIQEKKAGRAIILSIVFACTACVLIFLPASQSNDLMRRLTAFSTLMYPIPVSLFLLLNAGALLCIVLFSSKKMRSVFSESNALVCLGRSSLTVLIIHAILFRQAAIALSLYKLLSKAQALIAIAAILAAFTLLARLWQKAGYMYGAEWLLRRMGSWSVILFGFSAKQ